MYLKSNNEVRSYNCCCSGKAININNSGCMLLALGSQLAMSLDLTAICGLSDSTVFFHTIS